MEILNKNFEMRPWGVFWVLEDTKTHKVKRIEVNPKKRLSLQYHLHRAEVWTIIQGVATVTIDNTTREYLPGEVAIIPQGALHRIENRTDQPIFFIEVQHGNYFGEDDIVRIEDDFNRI